MAAVAADDDKTDYLAFPAYMNALRTHLRRFEKPLLRPPGGQTGAHARGSLFRVRKLLPIDTLRPAPYNRDAYNRAFFLLFFPFPLCLWGGTLSCARFESARSFGCGTSDA